MERRNRETLERILNEIRINPSEMHLLKENEKLKQEVASLK